MSLFVMHGGHALTASRHATKKLLIVYIYESVSLAPKAYFLCIVNYMGSVLTVDALD